MEIKTNKENVFLKLEVFYHSGGYSWATYEYEERGYYLLIVPEKHEARDGIHYTITSAFSGCKIFLESAKRLSKKRLAELTKNIDINDYKHIIDEIANQNNLILL